MDRLRGLAVVLMVLDHLAVVAGLGGWWRLGPTRFALPLFCFCAAVVPRSWSRRSLGIYGLLVLVELLLNPVIGLGWPGPVLLILGALLVLDGAWLSERAGRSAWLVVVTFGLVQALYWPVGWSGYEPGLVAVWCGLGAMAGRGPLDDIGQELSSGLLDAVGRRPALWYGGHLAVLACWVVLV